MFVFNKGLRAINLFWQQRNLNEASNFISPAVHAFSIAECVLTPNWAVWRLLGTIPLLRFELVKRFNRVWAIKLNSIKLEHFSWRSKLKLFVITSWKKSKQNLNEWKISSLSLTSHENFALTINVSEASVITVFETNSIHIQSIVWKSLW